MPCESVMSRKLVTAVARVRFNAGVNLGVSLKIVLSNKALHTSRALILAIIQVSLNVGLDVLLATKLLSAIVKQTSPFAICGLWSLDELCNLLARDASVGSRLFDIDICDASRASNAGC
jgi:hypothetical protein